MGDEMDIKKVFSRDKAIQLANMGNKVLYTEDNHKNSKFKVFCFINTEKLTKDWDRLK